jgi:hypothetical protein
MLPTLTRAPEHHEWLWRLFTVMLIALLMLLAFPAQALPAQAQPAVSPGTRIRLALPDSASPVIATMVSGDANSLTVTDAARQSRRIPLAELLRVEVSEGRSTHRRAGATVGGLLGGALFATMACGFSDGSCAVSGSTVGGFLVYYAIGAIPGAMYGASVGSRRLGDEQWREVWRRP